MITAHGLLCRSVARRTRRAESFHVFDRSLFFLVQLGLATRIAICKFSVPAFLADRAECIVAVFTYS